MPDIRCRPPVRKDLDAVPSQPPYFMFNSSSRLKLISDDVADENGPDTGFKGSP